MAKLTKADAARQLGISRTTLYKLIDQGRVSATPDGMIDTAELVRVMSTLNVRPERPLTPLDTTIVDTYVPGDEHRERPMQASSEHEVWTSSERQLTSSYRDMVNILREQLQAAQERERDYREHIARLTMMLDQAHQQNQRLLDMPRRSPQQSPQDARGATPARGRRESPTPAQGPPQGQPEAQGGDTRGDMRRRIVALLQDHPEGLTPAEIRALLGVHKRLADTCLGMLRDGLLRRVGPGRYVAAEPS